MKSEHKPVQFHLVLTQKCNLQCSYCEGEVDPEMMPVDAEFTALDLQNFFSQLDEPPVLAFYGGEPSLNLGKIKEVMDYVPAQAFVIQTNGTLLYRIPEHYIRQFNTILISIDGRPEITDAQRGRRTHKRAVDGAQYARGAGFDGDLIARMTINETSDIFQEVMYLINHEHPIFNHIHWQLDVLWDSMDIFEKRKENLITWIRESYNPGITRLIDFWVEQLTQGKIIGIVPFLGIMHTLLTGETSQLRCGSGIDFFSITTDGRLTVCPIPPSFEFTVGDIYSSVVDEISNKVVIDGPCQDCEVLDICGGRCLYANKTQFWGKEGFDLVCRTIKHLINELTQVKPVVAELINENIISLDDLNYPKIPNGVEIIP